MQVFKYYVKIAWSFRVLIFIYLAIFGFFSVSATMQSSSSDGFVVAKPKIAIINRDESDFSKGFVDYMTNETTIVDVGETDTDQKNAIFFRTVDVIYVVPTHFGGDFFAGKKPLIATMEVSGQAAEQAKLLSNKYLHLAELYVIEGENQADAVAQLKGIVEMKAVIKISSKEDTTANGLAMYYFNFEAYSLLAVCLLVIGNVMVIFNTDLIKRRNLIGGKPYGSIQRDLLIANAAFVLVAWALFLGLAAVMYPSVIFSIRGALYATSSLAFALVCLAIGFAVGSLVKKAEVLSGVTNVIALGMAFLCGVFVPQQFLGDGVLNIAKFLPAYWYVQANTEIQKITEFTSSAMRPAFTGILILLAFSAAIFATTFTVSRMRRK